MLELKRGKNCKIMKTVFYSHLTRLWNGFHYNKLLLKGTIFHLNTYSDDNIISLPFIGGEKIKSAYDFSGLQKREKN